VQKHEKTRQLTLTPLAYGWPRVRPRAPIRGSSPAKSSRRLDRRTTRLRACYLAIFTNFWARRPVPTSAV
jgi:hypothetical protein